MIPRDGSKDRVEGAPPEASRGTSPGGSSDAPLGRSNHRALERTRPIGTPPPLPAEFRRATIPSGRVSVRAAYRQTMMLGSLERSGVPVALRSEPVEEAAASAFAPAVFPTEGFPTEGFPTEGSPTDGFRTEGLPRGGFPPVGVQTAALLPVTLPALAEPVDEERVSFEGTAAELVAPASAPPRALSESRASESPTANGPASESPISEGTRLRGSFVRVVGPPTSPPPRRSRRPGPPSQPAPAIEMDPHEAFALDRPIPVAPPSATGTGSAPAMVQTADSAVVSRRDWYTANEVPRGVEPSSLGRSALILPPPPGAGDFEPASSPSAAAPPPLPGSLVSGHAPAPSPQVPALSPPWMRATTAPLMSAPPDLPTINPFAGFEAPRDSWLRRSVIIFVVALALVGVCALAAIAFGLIGKRGW
ncbi:MAG TPA: hypothetical protein VG963_12715 [Polyangiaceae bacterium]|nr:hypothetical protein [Polyangiaceae bacterium]